MNDGADQALNVIYLVGCLVLVLSALATRRLPLGPTVKMGAAWGLIFGAAFIAFAMKDDFAALGRHVLERSRGSATVVEKGGELRVRKAEDGHFWIDAKVNGQGVRFLVDSGATVTSLSAGAAEAAGVRATDSIPVLVNTANGIVKAQSGAIARLEVGSIRRSGLGVHISDAFGNTNVLGMNFLSSLRGWSVDGDWLILKP